MSDVRTTTTSSPRRRRRSADAVAGPVMAAPATLALIAFLAVPFGVGIYLSFFFVGLSSIRPPSFVGLRQYSELFTDPIVAGPFLRSLVNNLTFAVVVVPLQTALALLLAILLNRKLKGVAVYRTIFFMPVVFPMALVTVIWRLILSRSDLGLLNTLTNVLSGGLIGAHDWLGSSATAMASVIILSMWQGLGFQMIILLAGLQEIPGELYEAARLDRANAVQQFRHITVPGLRNTLIFVVMLTTILAFRVYDQVYILIKNGGLNADATRTVLYQANVAAFGENDLGQASAISVVFFVIVVALTLGQRLVLRQRSDS